MVDYSLLFSFSFLEGGEGESERARESRGKEERERERILSRFHAQCGAPHRAGFHNPEITTGAKIKSQTLNQLSHQSASTILV